MDPKLLLIKCITLLYKEAQLKTIYSKELCLEAISFLKLPELDTEGHMGLTTIMALKEVINWMVNFPTTPYDKTQFLQQLRLRTRDETYLFDAVTEAIQTEDEQLIKEHIQYYKAVLQGFVDDKQVKNIVSGVYNKMCFETEYDVKELIKELSKKLEPYMQNSIDRKHPSIVDSVSFSDPSEMETLLKKSKEEITAEGVLKTGYQGINRMLGSTGGFRRGEFATVYALKHNFKTGFTLNLFKHFALYNTPYMRDPNKKPLLLHISLENELPMNLLWLYCNLKENETGSECYIGHIEEKEAADYISHAMGVNGYHVDMIRLDPTKTKYDDIIALINNYEMNGFEVHAVICDYLSKLSKKGLDRNGPMGTEIRELFDIMRNFCAPRGITFITPHQMSTEALGVLRNNPDEFVKVIANKGYIEGSKQIDQVVDLEFNLHIDKRFKNSPYLTVHRGKHRTVKITPEEHLYCALPFNPVGGIKDDINGKDTSRKNLNLDTPNGTADEWFD